MHMDMEVLYAHCTFIEIFSPLQDSQDTHTQDMSHLLSNKNPFTRAHLTLLCLAGTGRRGADQ